MEITLDMQCNHMFLCSYQIESFSIHIFSYCSDFLYSKYYSWTKVRNL